MAMKGCQLNLPMTAWKKIIFVTLCFVVSDWLLFLFESSLIGGSDYKLIYRHYATLYFVFCVDSSESELGILDLIQVSFSLSLVNAFFACATCLAYLFFCTTGLNNIVVVKLTDFNSCRCLWRPWTNALRMSVSWI